MTFTNKNRKLRLERDTNKKKDKTRKGGGSEVVENIHLLEISEVSDGLR